MPIQSGTTWAPSYITSELEITGPIDFSHSARTNSEVCRESPVSACSGLRSSRHGHVTTDPKQQHGI
jgi:hypothetical protein